MNITDILAGTSPLEKRLVIAVRDASRQRLVHVPGYGLAVLGPGYDPWTGTVKEDSLAVIPPDYVPTHWRTVCRHDVPPSVNLDGVKVVRATNGAVVALPRDGWEPVTE